MREYHRQNIDILSAPEHAAFEVSYSNRWIQSGLRPEEGEGAVIVFADSPYQDFDPIRFAVIEQVLEEDRRLVLKGRLGPFVCCDDPTALSSRWSAISEDDDDKPGRRRFLVSDDNVGLFTPSSPSAADDAWRSAVDALSANSFFEDTTIARLIRATVGDRELETGSAVSVGDLIRVDLELRTPHGGESVFVPSLVAEPEGAAALDDPGAGALPSSGVGSVTIRALEPGPLALTVGIAGRSLSSSRVPLTLEVLGDRPSYQQPTPATEGPVDVTAVARLLTRNATLDHGHWLELLDDHLLRARPDEPVLLNLVAEHASALGRHDRAVSALDAIADRTPDQQVRLLEAAVLTGANARLEGLLDETDLSNGEDFDRFLAAVVAAPEATVNIILRSELRNRHLGDEHRASLVMQGWPRLSSIDLMCEAADHVAYVDPEAGARLLLKQWPQPHTMPDRAIDLLLDWRVNPHLLGPYVRERLRRAIEADDLESVEALVEHLDCIARGDRPALLLECGRSLIAGDDALAQRGLQLCEQGVHEALSYDQIDTAVDALAGLRSSAAAATADFRTRVDALGETVDSAIVESDALLRWERMRSETRADALRPFTTGKRLFALGGRPVDGFDQLARDLGLADHRWTETDKDKGPRHDWANGLREGDIVIAVLPWIGHGDTTIKNKAIRKGARYEIVHHNTMSILDGVERAIGPHRG